MIKTRLILIEGLPGSGKSTFGQFIGLQLKRNKINAEWYNECELNHPVQFEYEAGFSKAEFDKLLEEFNVYSDLLQKEAIERGGRYFINYIDLTRKHGNTLDSKLIDSLSQYDVFEGCAERYMDMSLKKWECFVEKLIKSDVTVVLESSIFQVQVNCLRTKTSFNIIDIFINKLLEIISPLNPVMIYFYQNDTKFALERAVQCKGDSWLDFISQRRSFDEQVKRFDKRKQFEYGIFNGLCIRKLLIENTKNEWRKYEDQILAFLDLRFVSDDEEIRYDLQNLTGRYQNARFSNDYTDKYNLYIENGCLVDKESGRKLVQKDHLIFCVQGLPTELQFTLEGEKVKGFAIGGRAVPEENIAGTYFNKIEKGRNDDTDEIKY